MACGYCYHSAPKDLPFKRGLMSFELASKILKESADIGVHSIKTNFRGESSMNPNFSKITKLAKDLAHGSTFIDRISNTNFNFKKNVDEIIEGFCNQTKVKISFDSFQKEVLETQRKGANHGVILANIDKFYNHPLRISNNTEMVIQAVRTSKNKDEDLVGEIKKRWPSAKYSVRDMVAGRVDSEKVKELETKKRDASQRQTCIQGHARLMVHWDGQVAMCCPDIKGKLIIGNANKEHIKDIFNSKDSKQIRKELKNKKAFEYDPCKTCSSFESYKGFKAAFHS